VDPILLGLDCQIRARSGGFGNPLGAILDPLRLQLGHFLLSFTGGGRGDEDWYHLGYP